MIDALTDAWCSGAIDLVVMGICIGGALFIGGAVLFAKWAERAWEVTDK